MGIPVRMNFSVLLLVGYILFSTVQGGDLVSSVSVGIYLSTVLLVSILLHELAHSVVALAFGGGVRDITLQLLGGCASLTRMPPRPWQECLMALAGPLCSFVVAVLFYFLAVAVFPVEEVYVYALTQETFTRVVPNVWLELVAMMNVGLGAFNLVPAFPMDGGRVLRSLLQVVARVNKVRATVWAVYVGRCIALIWGSVCVLELFGGAVPRPEGMSAVVAYGWDLLFGGSGILLALIAYMIWVSGMRELQYVRYEAYYGVSE